MILKQKILVEIFTIGIKNFSLQYYEMGIAFSLSPIRFFVHRWYLISARLKYPSENKLSCSRAELKYQETICLAAVLMGGLPEAAVNPFMSTAAFLQVMKNMDKEKYRFSLILSRQGPVIRLPINHRLINQFFQSPQPQR